MIRASIIVLLFLTAGALVAEAQIVNPATADAEAASLGLGFDHGGVLELGYRRPLRIADDTALQLRLQAPSSPGLGDGAVSLLATRGWRSDRGWGATVTLGPSVRWVDAELLGVGQGAIIAGGGAGLFRRRGFAAAELTWEHSLVTYVRPTDMYRRVVYAESTSGFHGAGGGTLRGGLAVAVVPAARVEVGLRAGYMVTERLGVVAGLPFYGVIDVQVRR